MTIGLIDFNRIREFDELLGENVIDIRKLRRLCFNGTNIEMLMCVIAFISCFNRIGWFI